MFLKDESVFAFLEIFLIFDDKWALAWENLLLA